MKSNSERFRVGLATLAMAGCYPEQRLGFASRDPGAIGHALWRRP